MARPFRSSARWLRLSGLCCALTWGCAHCQIPRIDPTGERLFAPATPTASIYPPPSISPLPSGQTGLAVSPAQVIAPVGSEVVMIATLTAPEGYPLLRERIEWSLAPEGPGQIVSPGERRSWDILHCLHKLPQKVNNQYAINTTLSAPVTIDRGTPTPTDDILVQAGQSWVSVTSTTEGTTHVTALSPNTVGWDRRRQTASIYWVDAQWRFPPPAITSAGGRNMLTTTITRHSDSAPLAGWIVRYEVAPGGPPAGFAPDGGPAVEVLTGAGGEASAEIFQTQPFPGSNQINIQVRRPGNVAGQASPALPVGTGTTMQTWTTGTVPLTPITPGTPTPVPVPVPTLPPSTSPPTEAPWTTPPPADVPTTPPAETGTADLEVTVHGPSRAVVGSDVQFELAVTNRGTATARKVLISNRFDEGLEHAAAQRVIERDLVDLDPGATTRMSVTFHVSRPGELCQDVTVSGEGGVRATARQCITAEEPAVPAETPPIETPPAEAPPTEMPPAEAPAETPTPARAGLTVTKRGPDRRRVGEMALFIIEVTNRGETTIENLEIADNYEVSLQPNRATEGSELLQGNAIGWKIPSLPPGRIVRREIELKCLRDTPRACNRVTVTAPGMDPIADEACLEIVAEVGAAAPPAAPAEPRAAPPLSVSIAETADPVRLDGVTTYQVLLSNKGEDGIYDVGVTVKFSEQLRLEDIYAPVQGQVGPGSIKFTPLRELRGGESPSFELRFKGVKPGTARVQVEVTSRGQAKPITSEQTTEVLE